jgi:transposase
MTRRCGVEADGGFALLEVVIALALFVLISIGVARLIAVGTSAARTSREHTSAVVLASARMDQLRGLAWSYGPATAGVPRVTLTDRSTNLSREDFGNDGPGLGASPGNTLTQSVPPYVDYLDARGRWVGNDASPPDEAVFVRRWAVRPLPSDPERTIVLQVLVTTVAQERSRAAPWQTRSGTEVLLVSVRTRTVQ